MKMVLSSFKNIYVDLKTETVQYINMLSVKELEEDEKVGVLFVGLCGNNGSTFVATAEALKNNTQILTTEGFRRIELLGSLSEFGSIDGDLIRDRIHLLNIKNMVIGGWDIVDYDVEIACYQNGVLNPLLLRHMNLPLFRYKPMRSIFDPDFIASNHISKATHVKGNSKDKYTQFQLICSDIQSFKIKHNLKHTIVFWSASTERMSKKNFQTKTEIFKALRENDTEISPSIIFALAAIQNNCTFVNGSPQNTINEAILEFAKEKGTFAVGSDLKTGQTKIKSVLVDFLTESCFRPLSIVSYNYLGNEDGRNLSEEPQFKSKEHTKRDVIDDVIDTNPHLFSDNKRPEHLIRIDYVKASGDTKRAIDEYNSELMFNKRHNLVLYNTCEDSILAVPVMLDIIVFSEFMSRIRLFKNSKEHKLNPNLSLLSLFFKSPVKYKEEPVVNAFFAQLYALKNFIRMCLRMKIPDFVNLQERF